MAMTLLVVMALNRAPNAATWQRAMTESHVPVHFSRPVNLEVHSGFVPLTLRGSASGFYFLREDFADLSRHYAPLAHMTVEKPVVYSLGYGGHGLECASAFYSASVLVSQFGGVAFDPEGGELMSARSLQETAEVCLALDDP